MKKLKTKKPANSVRSLKTATFSRSQLLTFSLIFAAIGGYIIYSSFAAAFSKTWDTDADWNTGMKSNVSVANGSVTLTPSSSAAGTSGLGPTFGSFESGNLSEFSDSTCHPENMQIITSPVRQGNYAAKFSGNQSVQCYGDSANVRVHAIGFPSGVNMQVGTGQTFWLALSIYMPSSGPSNYLYAGPEVHEDAQGPCSGPVPFTLGVTSDQWIINVRGNDAAGCSANAGSFIQHTFGGPDRNDGSTAFSAGWANGVSPSIQYDKWYDFLIGDHMAADNSGWIEAWVNGPGTNGRSINIVPRQYMMTSYPNLSYYPMLSLYYPSSIGGTHSLIYDGGRFATDPDALKTWQDGFTHSWNIGQPGTYSSSGAITLPLDAGTASSFSGFAATDSKPAGTNIVYEARSSCDNTNWSSWGGVSSVPAGRYIQIRATLSTANSSATPSIDKLSISYDANATACGGSVTPPPPPPPSGTPTDCTNGCAVIDGQPVTITGPTRLLADNSNEIVTQSDGTGHRLYPTAQVSDTTIRSFDQKTVTVVGAAVGTSTNFPINVSSIALASSTTKTGDLNGDNSVNIQDLSILLSHFSTAATAAQGDLNGDGKVTILDLSVLLSKYGS